MQIRQPCDKALHPDGEVWFCETCEQTVADLSAMSRRQAEAWRAAGGRCGRMAVDAQGRGQFRPSRRRLVLAAIAGVLVSFVARASAIPRPVAEPTDPFVGPLRSYMFQSLDEVREQRELVEWLSVYGYVGD